MRLLTDLHTLVRNSAVKVGSVRGPLHGRGECSALMSVRAAVRAARYNRIRFAVARVAVAAAVSSLRRGVKV
jgi:hypothetical protein